MLILDNGREAVGDLVPADPRIRYVRETGLRTLGGLRNRACALASGELIAHWDDDDWYPTDRLRRQVAALANGQADVCGSSRIYFLDSPRRRAWEYVYADKKRPWVAGATLAYRRELWSRNPFPEIQAGEDTRFVWSSAARRIADLADPGLCVAAIHAGNTSPKRPIGSLWRPVDATQVLALVESTVLARPEATAAARATPQRGEVGVAETSSSETIAPSRVTPGVCLGIYIRTEPQRLDETLRYIATNTRRPIETVLLGDGPDEPTARRLSDLGHYRQSCTLEPRGAAACFNRLVRENDAELYIFLESGALVGPEWLDRMLAALNADASHGLVGPTTNMAWSVQGAFRDRRATPGNVTLLAEHARVRYGNGWRSLEPLYCLADFCYAVRREVVQAIGAADEGYDAGPCWEMDYTVRAARAGFRAVWAQSAYVFRYPFTQQRQMDETRLHAASKQRYQGKFCGQRLSGARAGYAEHCRGDACPHFAPAAQIEIKLPLQQTEPSIASSVHPAPPSDPTAVEAGPLITCIMPTLGRLDWVLQSIRYFQRQDYPQRELIIVDDGTREVGDHLPCDPQVHYVNVKRRMSIGAKRNLACEAARGAIIAHWDDDDWYSPTRLSAQVAPLLSGEADITALDHTVFFDMERWQFFQCSDGLFARLFALAVHGGTLVFRKELFGARSRYPNASLAEDAVFLRAVVPRGARLQRIRGDGLYLYVRHGMNSWKLACGGSVDAGGWLRVSEPETLGSDVDFYQARRQRIGRQHAG